MTLKKTIAISIVFHVCFFSAALLLSAGLLEGKGRLPDTKVVFVKLADDDPQPAGVINKKPRIVKEAEKQPVAEAKEPEIAEEEVAVEKSEDKVVEEPVPAAKETVSEELFAGEDTGYVSEHGEEMVTAEAANDQHLIEETAAGGHGMGLIPETIELISMAIERVKTYPAIARKRGLEGTVHVSFNITADGTPNEIKILKSSGFGILDRATVQVVKKAAPFPLVANRIELPVAYRLKN
jgi:protein TonB